MTRKEATTYLVPLRKDAERDDDSYRTEALNMAIEALKDRPKGEWIKKEGIHGAVYCSECNYELRVNNTNFCPNCGADMRGEEE